LEERRSVGASSCDCGDGTDQRVQSLMSMMMILVSRLSEMYNYEKTTQYPTFSWKVHKLKKGVPSLVTSLYTEYLYGLMGLIIR